MKLQDLDEAERGVFLALLAHLAEADARIDPSEILALDSIAEEMGVSNMRERLMRARGATPTRADLLAAISGVTRPEARVAIRAALSQLAESDGERAASESDLLDALAALWRD